VSNIKGFIEYCFRKGTIDAKLADRLEKRSIEYEAKHELKTDPAEKVDNVNHPKHYCREGGMECLDEMLMLYGAQEVATWCKLNAHKYRYRAADKNGKEDIAKSDFYMKKYKELTEGKERTTITWMPR
jgi:hypothetical protein